MTRKIMKYPTSAQLVCLSQMTGKDFRFAGMNTFDNLHIFKQLNLADKVYPKQRPKIQPDTDNDSKAVTVELQLLKHLWNHENMFETGVVRANECNS